MPPQSSTRMTAIQFANGFCAVAPTDQWLALIFDVLHPSQQEAIISRVNELAKAHQDRPLVTVPGHQPSFPPRAD